MQHHLDTSAFLFWVAVSVVTIGSVGRISRLVTWDVFPPSQWVRKTYTRMTGEDSDWKFLVECGYCFGVWAAAFVVGWGYLFDWNQWWWLFNGGMAAAYGGSILMARDGDEG